MNLAAVSRSAAVLIAAIASARCLVVLLPETWFAFDPVLDPKPSVGLAPHWLMALDALLLVAASVGLVCEGVLRRGGSRLSMILWVIPVPLCLQWAFVGGHHGQVVLPWMAGVTAAMALAHLCRDPHTRRLVVAILIAVAAPIALQALTQWGWDNPDTAAWFIGHRDEALALMGLEPGSSAAMVYERRLLEGTPSGWFTSANLLATVMAACAIVFAGLTFAAQRQSRTAWVGGPLFVACLVSAGVVGLSGSLAGLVLLIAGVVIAACGFRYKAIRVWGGWIAITMIAMAAIAPVAAAGLEAMGGDQAAGIPGARSMLIRWQYDIGAARLVAEAPLEGVGPAGFQDAYASVRVPGAPEEITSPHSMMLGWMSTIGVAGLSWVLLVLVLMWRAGTSRFEEDDPPSVALGFVAPIGAVLAILPSAMVTCQEWGDLDEASQLVRVFGWALMLPLAWLAWRAMQGMAVKWAVFVAAAVLITQAQVEMSLESSATVVWVLAMLGAAAAPIAGRGRAIPLGGGMLSGVLAIIVVAYIVLPWWKQDQLIERAAQALVYAPGDASGLEGAVVRGKASALLNDAWIVQHDPRVLVYAAEQQLAAAADAASRPEISVLHLGAAAKAGGVAMDSGSIAGGRLAIVALAAKSDVGNDREALLAAMTLAERVAAADPNAAMSWVTIARLADRLGDQAGASAAWKRAIESDNANTLDPAQRLPKSIRDEAIVVIEGRGQPPQRQ